MMFVLQKISNIYKAVLVRNLHLYNKSYVNGNWVSAACNKTFDVKNPADGSLVGTVPDMAVEDVQIALEKAYEAFHIWQEITAKERSLFLRKWYDLMVKNSEELANIMTLESGKPMIEARGEVAYGNSFIEWFSEEARRIDGEIIQSPVKTKQIILNKQPIGVAALITPWNFPHAMITRKAGAALAAGCSCVVKPAEDTPLTALALAELSREAGIPKGVFNVVTTSRSNAASVGKLFCESPLVAGISFTGSTQVGKCLYQQCASGVKRLGLELGGNAPFIVFCSADIDKAVQGAIASKFRNCGQTCVSANRFLIQENVYDIFVEKLKMAMKHIVLGNGLDPQVTAGPLINVSQVNKVQSIVQDALEKGAQVEAGGNPAIQHGELFYEPTLLTNVKENMLCYNEEIFGPVAPCISFKTEEEALKIANNTNRGLAGYFYSNDISQIFRVSRKLEVGMVGVNEGIISTAEAAFGGIKESGIGREGSRHGIDDFVYIKYMCLGNL